MPKTVLALVLGGRSAASSRIRAHIPLDFLESTGHFVRRVTCEQKTWPLKLVRLALSRRFDVVYLQKVMPPKWLMVVLRARCQRIVFDLDDAIYLGYPGGPARQRRRIDKRVKGGLHFTDSVLTSNKLIRSDLGLHSSSKCVVFPGPAPQSLPDSANDCQRENFVLWLGSPSTLSNIEALLRALRRRLPEERFLIIGSPFDSCEDGIRRIQWSREVEADALRRSRVGLMPLEQTDWNDRKAGYKILEYLKGGVIPVVADSPIVETLLGPDAALLCEVIPSSTSPDEWAAGIGRALARVCDETWFSARERVFSTWNTKKFAGLILGSNTFQELS